MKVRELLDALLRFDKDKTVCVGVDGGYRHIDGVTAPDGVAIMIPTIELGQEVDFRWPEVDRPSKVAPHPPAFGETPKTALVSKFDFPRLRKMLDECVRSLNDVVVAQTKDDGFDMPVGMWKAIEQADYLVNSARDAIPVRTVIRYPAWLDVYVDTAVDDHRITKVTAMTQGNDAGNLSTKTSGFALEHEDADVADSVLRFTDRASWPDPKLEG